MSDKLRTTDPMLDYCDLKPDTGDELQEWYRRAYRAITAKSTDECTDEELATLVVVSQAIDLLIKYGGRDFRDEFWKDLDWGDLTSWADSMEKLQQMEGKATD